MFLIVLNLLKENNSKLKKNNYNFNIKWSLLLRFYILVHFKILKKF